MSNPTIAMIGYGCVGRATAEAFHSKSIKVIGIDPVIYPKSKIENALAAGIAMICVPTPMMPTSGRQDTSIVAEVIRNLSAIDYKGLVVIKSTVLPSFVVDVMEDYAHLRICTNPEFLNARSAEEDAAMPEHILVGALYNAAELFKLYADLWPDVPVHSMSPAGAMMYKYIYNTLGAVTVSVMNEFWGMHHKLKMSEWGQIEEMCGNDHMLDCRIFVPGPDGKPGWGGACYGKDINAIINMARDLEVPAETLEGAVATNLIVRKGE